VTALETVAYVLARGCPPPGYPHKNLYQMGKGRSWILSEQGVRVFRQDLVSATRLVRTWR
jgi:hypothetical protein